MPVTVQCVQCGLRYAAPDALIGKRVRCKRCSAVFTVAEVPTGDAVPAVPPSDVDSAMLSEMDDIDAILRGGGGEGAPLPDDFSRPVQPIDYPYRHHVERFLPLGLLLVSLGLIVSQTLAQDDLGRPWVPAVRMLIVLGLYAVIVFPITYAGVRHGVRKQGGHMPWSPGWKTFAIFTIAYALSYMLWLAGTNIPSLLLGCLAGLAVALTTLFLVFRLPLGKGPDPLVWGGTTFVLGMILAGGFAAGLNVTVFAITTGSQTAHTFAASPILPGLPWNPKTQDPDESQPPPVVPPVQLATPGDADPVDLPQTLADPSEITTDPAPAEPSDASADRGPTVIDPADNPEPVIPPVADQSDPTGPQADHSDPVVPPEDPPQQSVVTIKPSESIQIDYPPVQGGFERIIYPLADGDAVAVIRADGDNHVIERLETTSWTRTAQARFQPDDKTGDQYVISPDGAALARIVNWPSLSIQIWSFDEQRVSSMLELNADNGQPILLGFPSASQILVGWESRGAYAVELFDLQTRRRGGAILEGVETLDGNFALSHNGRMFAVAARTREGPVVKIHNISAIAGQPMRTLPIRLLDARWGVHPMGMAFSEDGSGFSAYFEQDGNGLLLNWSMPLGRESQPYIFPAGSLPPRPRTGIGRVFSYFAADQVLLYGRDVIDTQTGRLIGSTGIQTAQRQHPTANGVHVVYLDENGSTRLAVVSRSEAGEASDPEN